MKTLVFHTNARASPPRPGDQFALAPEARPIGHDLMRHRHGAAAIGPPARAAP
jgi:hypothetical protein